MIIIFSYDRPDMLLNLVNELQGERVIVIDDGSDFDITPFLGKCEFHRGEHLGKEYFWKAWDYALRLCKESSEDRFFFMPDDFINYDMETLNWIFNALEGKFAFNFANFGMDKCWTPVELTQTDIDGFECYKVGFVDCAFMTNRETLDSIGWYMDWISPLRFRDKHISSGVGQQLSRRLWKNMIPMYKPIHSLCEKATELDVSKMNPEERELNQRPML